MAALARIPLVAPLVLALGMASAGEARAQSAADRAALAQGLYDSAAELIKAGKFAEACPKLEESQRLDPAMGTQFFLAGCYEKTGRPTSAWSLFLEVAAAAKAAGNTVRESTAHARAAALEPRLPRLRIVLADATAALPGLEVSRDGAALKPVAWGAPIPVDFGEHTVRVKAPGKAAWETKVAVNEPGQKVDVTVPALSDRPADVTPTPAPTPPTVGPAPLPPDASPETRPPPPAGLPGQRVAAIVVGSVGVAGVVAGTALGLVARSTWNQALAECPTRTGCSADAHDLSNQSLSQALGSTVAFAAGGTAIAGALVLWFTAPSPRSAARLRIVPVVAAGTAGAFVTGGF